MYHRLPEEGEGEGEGEGSRQTDTAAYSGSQRVQGTGFYSDEEAMNMMRELEREEDWEDGTEGVGGEAGLELAPLSTLPGGASERVMVSDEVEFNDDCEDDNDREEDEEDDDDDEGEEGEGEGEESYGIANYNCDEDEEEDEDEDEDEDDQFDSHDDGRDEDSEGDGDGGADGDGDSEEDGEPSDDLLPESDREVLHYTVLYYTILYFIVFYSQEYRVPELLIAGINHRYYIILSPKKFYAKLHTQV
jgi:hypothetical protein